MKKFAALLMAVMMVLCMTIAAVNAESITMYLTSVSMRGTEMNPADMGMEMAIVFNDDGTCVMIQNGEETPAAPWTSEGGVITIDDGVNPLSLTVEGNQMIAEQDGIKLVFGTEPAAAAVSVAGEPVAAESAAAFNGSWVCVELNLGGIVMSVSAISAEEMQTLFGTDEIKIVCDNGAVSLFGQDAIDFAFENGVLTLSEDVMPATLTLTSNGYLNADLMGMVFVCAAE